MDPEEISANDRPVQIALLLLLAEQAGYTLGGESAVGHTHRWEGVYLRADRAGQISLRFVGVSISWIRLTPGVYLRADQANHYRADSPKWHFHEQSLSKEIWKFTKIGVYALILLLSREINHSREKS